MILGIGTDIIEIPRIAKAIKSNDKFLHRVFTHKEIEYFTKKGFADHSSINNGGKNDNKYIFQSAAGNFAAKEAVSKALGTGIRGFSFKDIEILRDNKGKPVVYLYGKAEELAMEITREALAYNYRFHITISHSRENAIAYAILEVL